VKTPPHAALGDVADFINGMAFKPSDWSEAGARIIRIQNLTDPSKQYNRTQRTVPLRARVHPGDLLVSWSATLGVFEWSGEDVAVLNQHIFRVVPDDHLVAKRYLKHLLVGAIADMERHLHGATMKHVNRGEFLNTTIPLPALGEQRRIAQVLDAADALRGQRRLALRTGASLTPAALEQAFGTVEANDHNLPARELREVCSRITDGTHQSPDWTESGVPFLFVSNIMSGEIVWDTAKHVSEATHAALTARCPIEPGDVLYSTVGSYGVPAVVRTSRKFAFQRHIAHIKPRRDEIHPEYLRAVLASPSLQRQADRVARGVAQKTLNLAAIQRFRLLVPSLADQIRFAALASRASTMHSAGQRHLALLDRLFTALQRRAFTGSL
jgi:type I restriction enzyme S subunit